MDDTTRSLRQGYAAGLASYLIWGFLPIYFKSLSSIGGLEIVAQRVGWSVLFLLAVILWRRQSPELLAQLANRRVMGFLAITAFLIGSNWTLYVLAVTGGHIMAASLGYFLNPLVSVMLGVVILKEKLRPMQMLAIAFALVGVANLAFAALDTLWISLLLALSFGFYGLFRKIAPVGALPGVAIETLILLPFALAYLGVLAHRGELGFGRDWGVSLLLTMAGVLTSVPLLLFSYAARRLPLATVGLIQYIAPTMQFLIGYFLYGEPLGAGKLISFLLIWVGLAIFTHDILRAYRRREASVEGAGVSP